MLTAAECRVKALEKLGRAKLEKRRSKSLTKAAEAWLHLAQILDDGEAFRVATKLKQAS
jgi:hypothetical protein